MKALIHDTLLALGLALVACLGVILGYQVTREFTLDLGSSYDGPFVEGFHDREQNSQFTFRWTSPSARIVLPAVGVAEWVGQLRLATPPVDTPWIIALDGAVRELGPGVVEVALPAKIPDALTGSWALDLKTAPFKPPTDPRTLGVAVDSVTINTSSTIVWPPLTALMESLAVVLWIYVASRTLGWQPTQAAVAAGASAVLVAAATAWDRTNLYVLWPRLGTVLAIWTGALALAAALRFSGHFAASASTTAGRLATSLLVVEAMAASLYIFHPQAHIWDATFHVHRLEFVATGQIAVPVLSTEFGTRPIPYPPLSYLPLLPLFWAGIDGQTLVRLGLIAALVAMVAVSVRMASTAGANVGLSALLLVTFPVLIMALSWGIYANLAGLVLAYSLFVMCVKPSAPGIRAAALGTASALSHVSMAIIAPITLLLAGLWQNLLMARGMLRMTILAGTIVAASFAAFYFLWTQTMVLEVQDILASRALNPGTTMLFAGGSVSDPGVGLSRVRLVLGKAQQLPAEAGFKTERVGSWAAALVMVARGLYSELRAYFRVWPALMVPLGLMLLAFQGRRAPLALFLAVLCTSILLWAVGVLTGLFVRYFLLAAPCVAILAASTLSELGGRGTLGLAAMAGIIAFQVWEDGALWTSRLLTVGH